MCYFKKNKNLHVFRQVERRFHNQELNHQLLHSIMDTSPLPSSSLGPSHTTSRRLLLTPFQTPCDQHAPLIARSLVCVCVWWGGRSGNEKPTSCAKVGSLVTFWVVCPCGYWPFHPPHVLNARQVLIYTHIVS